MDRLEVQKKIGQMFRLNSDHTEIENGGTILKCNISHYMTQQQFVKILYKIIENVGFLKVYGTVFNTTHMAPDHIRTEICDIFNKHRDVLCKAGQAREHFMSERTFIHLLYNALEMRYALLYNKNDELENLEKLIREEV